MAKGDFYKKLNAAKTAPEGNCYVRKNVAQIEPGLDLDDATALKNAGWCFHLNEQQPSLTVNELTKEWQNNGDVRVGVEADNTWGFNWVKVDISSTLSADELNSLKSVAWSNLRTVRKDYLTRTDWWELPSQTPISAERTAYRQALRDLPANTTDPFNVTWPTPPEDID
jgi:hypothetical protein